MFLGMAEPESDTCHCGAPVDHGWDGSHYGIPDNCNCFYDPPRLCPAHPHNYRYFKKRGISHFKNGHVI
jgi:hypothetical protein